MSASDSASDKITVWVNHNTTAGDFISVVLIRTLPGALRKLIGCHRYSLRAHLLRVSVIAHIIFTVGSKVQRLSLH